MLRKSIAFIASILEPLLTREYLAKPANLRVQAFSSRSWHDPGVVDASLPKVNSKSAVAQPTGASPRRQAPMNLPNSLTLLRIFFVPVLIVILLTRSPNVELWGYTMHFEVWGVLILLMAGATD